MRMLFLFLSFSLFISQNGFSATDNSKAALQVRFPVEKYRLKNGLTVLLHQDRSIPLITYHTWYRVGSRDEKPGVTGAAHMLEHMMFKGAKKYSGKEFDRILHENGIVNNAFTSWDYTGFYQKLPSHKLELMMDMEVDRMRFLSLKQEDLTSELQVVGEERRWRVDNNPPSLLREMVLGELYKVHPYHWPVIGYMVDIQAYTPEKLKHFYDSFYVPNNAVLVLAGDFEMEKTKALIEKYYGALESKPVPEKKFEQEPEMTAPLRKTMESDVQSSTVMVTYPGVASGHPDSFAIDLATNVLGAGSSSRLYRQLVYKEQVAVSASSYSASLSDPGFIGLVATMKPGQKTELAEKVFANEIKKLQTQEISKKELEKSKNQVMKEFVDGLTTIDGKAQSLAVNEIIYGNYEKLFTDLEKYEAVTAQDIKRVAKKYFNPKHQVVGVLNPRKAAQP